ncbi:hypothetical protein QQF64_004932 [Cirrhinus molitorella]|uniref:Uncharacterized protein n=1 Tax=Cirrhinus molitorella TaxID=172907 RepID=A0ABR3MHN9_9TELE
MDFLLKISKLQLQRRKSLTLFARKSEREREGEKCHHHSRVFSCHTSRLTQVLREGERDSAKDRKGQKEVRGGKGEKRKQEEAETHS